MDHMGGKKLNNTSVGSTYQIHSPQKICILQGGSLPKRIKRIMKFQILNLVQFCFISLTWDCMGVNVSNDNSS